MTKTELIGTRLPPELVKRIDDFADSEFMNRSAAVRELLERGLHFGRKVLSGAEARKVLGDIMSEALKGKK